MKGFLILGVLPFSTLPSSLEYLHSTVMRLHHIAWPWVYASTMRLVLGEGRQRGVLCGEVVWPKVFG